MSGFDRANIGREAKFQERDLIFAEDIAEHHENFDDTFIKSLRQQFDARGFLTENQHASLTRVIDGWHMEEWGEREGFI